MALSDFLTSRPNSARLWYANGRWHTIGEVRESIRLDANLYNPCAAKRMALQISDPFLLARSLVALDGSAAQMLLVPPGTSDDLAVSFVAAARSQCIIRDTERGELRASVTDFAADQADDAGGSTQWILPTSGTTATPKLVAHRLDTLTDRVRVSQRLGELVWGLLYDLNRFAGLQVFFQALASRAALAITRTGDELAEALQVLVEAEVDALSATPTLWRKLLMAPASRALELKQLTLGGEIADQSVLDALRARFPDARIVHIYASTEAGVGFAVTDGKAGFPLGFVSAPPEGVEIRVDTDNHLLLRKANIPTHYLGSDRQLTMQNGFVDTGDLVTVGDERVYFRGRANGAINVGGNKVMPEEVEEVIRQVEGVADAAVFAKRSVFSGSLVAARLVTTSEQADLTALKKAVREACTSHLEPFKRPALIEVSRELKLSAAGKVERND